jgi:hypothetical protein
LGHVNLEIGQVKLIMSKMEGVQEGWAEEEFWAQDAVVGADVGDFLINRLKQYRNNTKGLFISFDKLNEV